jgi:hypothetical protein
MAPWKARCPIRKCWPAARQGGRSAGRHLKQNHIEHLEHNQLIASCCRHPENHEVEAFKSHPDELARFFCVGMHDERPVWGAA